MTFKAQNITLTVISVCLTLCSLEVALRFYHGQLFQFESMTAPFAGASGRMSYHEQLGWVPKPGGFTAGSNVTAAILRNDFGLAVRVDVGGELMHPGVSMASGISMSPARQSFQRAATRTPRTRSWRWPYATVSRSGRRDS